MNKVFAEYSTSTAFFVQLSKNQCNALLRVAAYGKKPSISVGATAGHDVVHPDALSVAEFVQVHTLKTLEARGLVFWHRDASGGGNGFGGLTKAGELMCSLLIEAGLTVENTNTVSMLRRLAA